jgi:hypothetical protein
VNYTGKAGFKKQDGGEKPAPAASVIRETKERRK